MERSRRSEAGRGTLRQGRARRARGVVAATLVAVAFVYHPAAAADGGDGERIDIHRAEPPRREERERAERWHRRWSRQAAPLWRVLERLAPGGPGGDPEAPVADPEWCRALASALVRFDRERALPAPLYAADRPLRRGLDELTAAAFACLEGRYHAAAHHVASGVDDFAEAAEVLHRYGVDL